ncbi:MAG: MarR family transcriptional regulator [Dehalococcoidia bacterium]|nr:MarR family transcriptional regulator [Dehalococcoidia bacterium]
MQPREVLVEKLVERMTRIQRHLRARRAAAWLEQDLTMQQAKTLFFLSDGPRRMSGIAKRFGVETPSATTMIDRLVAKGLVERGRDPSDRRAVVCSLTEAGSETVERFWSLRSARFEELAAELSAEELADVVSAMETMVAAIERLHSGDGSGRRRRTDEKTRVGEADR